jgi:hypothetical protein
MYPLPISKRRRASADYNNVAHLDEELRTS